MGKVLFEIPLYPPFPKGGDAFTGQYTGRHIHPFAIIINGAKSVRPFLKGETEGIYEGRNRNNMDEIAEGFYRLGNARLPARAVGVARYETQFHRFDACVN